MPFNTGFSAQFYDYEVLKYASAMGIDNLRHVVINANFVPQNTTANQRTVVRAGTIMALSATNAKTVVPFGTSNASTIVGVLARSIDILVSATAGNEPAAVFWHGCVFATSAIVGFTQYATQVIAALNTCKFE